MSQTGSVTPSEPSDEHAKTAEPGTVRSWAALTRQPWPNLAIAAALAAASWPYARIPTAGGLDESWQAALYLAIQRGVPFGSGLAWTYGPLGFLTVPWPWYGTLTLLAFLVAGALHLALCFTAVSGARRVLPVGLAVVVAYLAARGFSGFEPSEALLALTFAACAMLLLRDGGSVPGRWLNVLLVLGGVVAAAAALGKVSVGVFVGLIIATTSIGLVKPWWRGPAIVVGVAGVTALGAWLATGQRLGDIPVFVANAYELVRGYSEAMGVDRSPTAHWFLPAYVVAVAVVAWIGRSAAAGVPGDRRAVLAAVGALAAVAFFKVAFVRWGLGYAFGALLVALLAVSRPRPDRSTFLLGFAVVFLPLLAAFGISPLDSLNPIGSLRSVRAEAAIVFSPARWPAAEQANRARLRERFSVQPEILAELRGHSVHVDPFETGVIVAWPELEWRPVPVFQSYSTYTTGLDERNAAMLRSDLAPERILRATRRAGLPPETGPTTIDGRSGWFDGPATMLETFCRYDEVVATGSWEVLALTDRRCGSPEPLSTVSAATGSEVDIPIEARPDRFVIVRIHGLGSPIDTLVTAAFKAPEWYVSINGSSRLRLVPGTATDGLLLAVPASIERSPGFEFGPPRATLSVERGDKAARALTFEFLSVPLTRP